MGGRGGGADAQGATLLATGPGLVGPSPYHTELLNVASAAEVTHEAIMKQLEA